MAGGAEGGGRRGCGVWTGPAPMSQRERGSHPKRRAQAPNHRRQRVSRELQPSGGSCSGFQRTHRLSTRAMAHQSAADATHSARAFLRHEQPHPPPSLPPSLPPPKPSSLLLDVVPPLLPFLNTYGCCAISRGMSHSTMAARCSDTTSRTRASTPAVRHLPRYRAAH